MKDWPKPNSGGKKNNIITMYVRLMYSLAHRYNSNCTFSLSASVTPPIEKVDLIKKIL